MHRRSCRCFIPDLLKVGHLRLLVSPCSIDKTESVDENRIRYGATASKPISTGPLAFMEWATSMLPSWLINAIVMEWHHTKCKTEGDESPQ